MWYLVRLKLSIFVIISRILDYGDYVYTYVRGCVALGNDIGLDKCKTYKSDSTETTVCFCNEELCNKSNHLIAYGIGLMTLLSITLNLIL